MKRNIYQSVKTEDRKAGNIAHREGREKQEKRTRESRTQLGGLRCRGVMKGCMGD